MLSIMIRRELKELMQQRRYLLLVGAVMLVSVLTAWLAVQEYHQAERHAAALMSTHQQILSQTTSPGSLSQLAVRRPTALELIAPGISYDLGRWGINRSDEVGQLTGSLYTQEPLFAIVRTIDPLYVTAIVLSLIALLLSHGVISGEREHGTIRLLFSHPVSRLTVYLAKGIAVLLALVPMVALTMLLPLCFGLVGGISFAGYDLLTILAIMLSSLLFLGVCVAIGLACSIWWQQPRMSLLGALAVWLLLFLAWPRIGMTISRIAVPTATEAEISAQSAAFENDRWKQYEADILQSSLQRHGQESDDDAWAGLQRSDSLRRLAERDVAEHTRRLRDDLVHQQEKQQQLAMFLARLSPASTLTLAGSTLAGTSPALATSYYDALKDNFERFRNYVDELSKTNSDKNSFSISVENNNGKQSFHIAAPRRGDPLDLSAMPAFVPPAKESGLSGAFLADLAALVGSLCLFGILGLGKFLKADLL